VIFRLVAVSSTIINVKPLCFTIAEVRFGETCKGVDAFTTVEVAAKGVTALDTSVGLKSGNCG